MRKLKLLGLILLLCTIITLPGYAEELSSPEDLWAVTASLPGAAYGEGTVFEVTDSDYLNVTVTSTETVKLRVESVPTSVTIETVPSALVSSTFLTVSGLVPGKVYYVYLDGLENLQEITADATGAITFLHDLISKHFVMILPNHSTLIIHADSTGGDCEGKGIGVWTPETLTCTLTTDVNETIYLADDGLTLDGDGHTIQSPGSSGSTQYGVNSYDSNELTVKNVNINGFSMGILFELGANLTVKNNTINASVRGMILSGVSGTSIVTGNTVFASSSGLHHGGHAHLILDGNTFVGIPRFPGAPLDGIGLFLGISCATITNNVFDHWHGGAGFNSARPCEQLADFRTAPGTVYDAVVFMNNLVTNNSTGISGYDGFGVSLIWNNTIEQNQYGYAAGLWAWSELRDNNFLDNAQSIYLNSRAHWHIIKKNYYSEYDSPEEGCFDSEPDGYCDAPYAFLEFNNLEGEYKTDYFPRTIPVAGILPGWLNAPPTADAGDDFSAECTSPSGAVVTLDGTGSSDPDGDTLAYTWTAADGTVIATNATATISLPLGTQVFTLTVDDGNGETSTSNVTVTVADTTAPVITITGISDADVYEFGFVPVAGYEVIDVCSTTTQDSDSLTGGDGLGLGLLTYTVAATDESGNAATGSATYEVIATQAGTTKYINDLTSSGTIPANTGNSLLNMLNNAELGSLMNRLEALYNHLTAPGQAEEDQIPLEVVDTLINAVQYMISN